MQRMRTSGFMGKNKSAAPGAAAARGTFLGTWQADFLGEAVGVFGPEGEENRAILMGCRLDRELGDESLLVFDFHIEIILPEDRCRPLNDGGELSGGEPVIGIVRHPGLEAERGCPPRRSPAVQEGLVDASHLRDMRMERDESAIGKEEAEVGVGVIPEGFQENGGFHDGGN